MKIDVAIIINIANIIARYTYLGTFYNITPNSKKTAAVIDSENPFECTAACLVLRTNWSQ